MTFNKPPVIAPQPTLNGYTCSRCAEWVTEPGHECKNPNRAASQGVGKLSPEPLCVDCKHPKNDSRFHLDAPGDNWGAALHWFKPPKGGVEGVGQTARECYNCGGNEAGCQEGEILTIGRKCWDKMLEEDDFLHSRWLKHYKDNQALTAETLTLRAELQELGQQLEFDRTQVADGVTAIRKAIESRDWLKEGRGPYEWDDDRWHSEFAAACKEIEQALAPLAKIAADWTNCPKTPAEIAAARIELRSRLQEAEKALKEATRAWNLGRPKKREKS